MLSSVFSTIGYAIKIYSYLCIGYILLSWFLPSPYSRFPAAAFLSEICAPYLNWFRRFRFTQIGSIDFSPILALGILSVFSNIFYQMAILGFFSPFIIIRTLILIIWSFFSFVMNFCIIALIIRLILDFMPEYRSGNIAYMLDKFLSPLFVRVHRLSGGMFMSVRKQVTICLIILIIMRVVLGAIFGSAESLFTQFKIL